MCVRRSDASSPADDARLGPTRPVVIGYSLWQSRFGGNVSIVGRAVRINGAPRLIIGVLPRTPDLPWLAMSDLI